jgi:hypothetical protein
VRDDEVEFRTSRKSRQIGLLATPQREPSSVDDSEQEVEASQAREAGNAHARTIDDDRDQEPDHVGDHPSAAVRPGYLSKDNLGRRVFRATALLDRESRDAPGERAKQQHREFPESYRISRSFSLVVTAACAPALAPSPANPASADQTLSGKSRDLSRC